MTLAVHRLNAGRVSALVLVGMMAGSTPSALAAPMRGADGLHVGTERDASPPPPSAAEQPTDSWELVLPAVPVGGRVRLTLADGAVLESRLVEARPDAVVVDDKRVVEGRFITSGTMMRFSRADVTRVAMVNPPTNYTADRPNPAVVRFLVASWGVRQKVDLQTITAERIRARVVSIEQGGFTIVGKTTATRIAYHEVLRLRKQRMGLGKKIAIGAALFVGGTAAIAVIAGINAGCFPGC